MRRIITAMIALTVLPALMVVAAPAPEAHAFCNKYAVPLSPDYCPHEGHDSITYDALGFLAPELERRVVAANVGQDSGDSNDRPELHFTNCLFAESTAYIQSQYQKIIDVIAPTTTLRPDTAAAMRFWGELLHPVQDFYSHSGWVDPEPMGFGFGTTHAKFLLDPGLVNWRSIRPYAELFKNSPFGELRDIVAVEGPPSGLLIHVPTGHGGYPTGVVPVITQYLPGGFWKDYRGLMTAVSEPLNTVQQLCPPADGTDCKGVASLCIRHGDSGLGGECANDTPMWDNCFTHDRDERPYHHAAYGMAVAQTRHEWCRLLHMLRDQKGYDAASIPIALWVRDHGNMHPPGTPCAESTLGEPASVTVHFKGMWSPDQNPVGVSTFVAYTEDFRQSFRSTGGPARTHSGTGQICIAPGARGTIAATMWGYDKTRDHGNIGMFADDHVRIGTTVELHGPNYPTDVQTASSQHVRLEVSVTRDAHPAPWCGRTGGGGGGGGSGGSGGGGGGGSGGGGPGGDGGGPHKNN